MKRFETFTGAAKGAEHICKFSKHCILATCATFFVIGSFRKFFVVASNSHDERHPFVSTSPADDVRLSNTYNATKDVHKCHI